MVAGRRTDGATEELSLLGETIGQSKIGPSEYRREIAIGHLDREGNLIKIYRLFNAFPIDYKTASDFDASADDELSIETITLAYESFKVESLADRSSNPLDPRDSFKRLVRRAF